MISGMSKKRALLTICPLYLLFFMGDAFLTSYYALFFQSNGINGEQLSLLLGVLPIALCTGCFVLSPLAKNVKASLWLFRICAIVEAGFVFGYTLATSFESLLALTCIIGFVNGAPFSFMEGYAAPAFKQAGLPYARVRMFGTTGYMVALFLGYFILGNLPIRDCYYFAFGLFIAALIVSFFVPKVIEETPQIEEESLQKPNKKSNFPIYGVLLFLAAHFCFYGAFNSLSYLLPIRLKAAGVSDADYSLIRSFSMAMELAGLLTAPLWSRFFKVKKWALIASAALCVVCTSFGIYLDNGYALGYTCLLLSGVGKAILFAFQANYLQELIGDRRLGTVLTVNNGLVNLACGAINFSSSYIYDSLGFSAFFGILTGLEVLGLVFVCLLPSGGVQKIAQEK